MERPENNKWLDEALAETIGSEKPWTDFEQWKQQHPEAVKMLTSRAQGTPVPKHSFNIRNIIMKSSITKLAAAVVIITAVLIVINPFDSNGTSTVWAQMTEKVQQSHRNYVEELLAAVEAKDVEKIEFYADMLDEFWQKLGWLARAKSDLEIRARVIAQAKAISKDRDISDAMGIQMFLANSEEFLDWLEQIEDATWTDETIYVCKQIEEYSEEIRDGAASLDPMFPYVEHCMPIFVSYVEWFNQLPWLNPKQEVTTARLLKMVKRDLETAHREVLYSESNNSTRDTVRFLHRCVEQAEKNAERIAGKTEYQDTGDSSQMKKCKNLARYTKELSDLITYASIARWSIQEVDKVNAGQAYQRVLRNDFWSGGTFGDYLIERIERSSDLCNELLNEVGSQQ
jgi:hypothetical protein